MKRILILCLTLSLIGSLHAFAQTPNAVAEENWQTYLNRHPGLREHPEWLNNPAYLKDHPGMTKWLKDHPAVSRQARGRGMWDQSGAWRDSSWWRQHDANAAYKHHPEWAEHHGDWRDGDEDHHNVGEHHHWHHGHGWEKHHLQREEHHPGWPNPGHPDAQGPPGHN